MSVAASRILFRHKRGADRNIGESFPSLAAPVRQAIPRNLGDHNSHDVAVDTSGQSGHPLSQARRGV